MEGKAVCFPSVDQGHQESVYGAVQTLFVQEMPFTVWKYCVFMKVDGTDTGRGVVFPKISAPPNKNKGRWTEKSSLPFAHKTRLTLFI